jgi:A/G-specific adenine glycosylase
VQGELDPGAVLAWGAPRLRDLPWRRTRDPWAVLVSEVMLQQTQVVRVIPLWHRFMVAYPTAAACAAAPLGDVLRRWQGLGYPRRARNLHAAAAAVSAAGGFPSTIDGLRALPGIGPYPARAVLVFAFERDEAVVDTNIARVLARHAGRRLTATEVQAAADRLVPRGEGWVWNQALMDLGATVCRPVPRCSECPLQASCAWTGAGLAAPDPALGSAGADRRREGAAPPPPVPRGLRARARRRGAPRPRRCVA